MAQLLKHVHAILGHMHKRTYTDPSLSHLTPTPHTHLTLSPHTHSHVHLKPFHHKTELPTLPSLTLIITSYPSLTPPLHTSNTIQHISHPIVQNSPLTPRTPSLTSPYLTSHLHLSHLLTPLYFHLAVTDNGVPDGLIVFRHHCEPLGVHLHQVKVLEGWEVLETLLRR